jgi:ubiquinone/menaquinone biosynthesis C-methylase UbiE
VSTVKDCVAVFDSAGEAYERSFKVFLQQTDQKKRARQWLETFLTSLPSKQVLIDAGAGSGEVTSWLSPSFDKTIAVEPNPFLLEKLQAVLPETEAICKTILDATPAAKADLVLCSHTFYYIPQPSWMAHLDRLLAWMKPTGCAVIILQHHNTDCMKMLEHFCGHRFNLTTLADMLKAKHGGRYTMEIVRDDAYIETSTFESAFTIAEFMLNLLPLQAPPSKAALESYIRSQFVPLQEGYRFSCHQDFLQIRSAEAYGQA